MGVRVPLLAMTPAFTGSNPVWAVSVKKRNEDKRRKGYGKTEFKFTLGYLL